MDLKAQRVAIQADAHKLIEAAKAAGRNLNTEEISQLENMKTQLEELRVKIEAAEKSAELIRDLGRTDEPRGNASADLKAATLGDHFVKHLVASGGNLKARGTIEAPEYKAATDPHLVGNAWGAAVTQVDRQPVLPKRDRLVVADLFDAGQMDGAAITYPVFGALEGGTGWVKEAGKKPQLHFGNPEWRTDMLSEVAGWFDISDNMLEDLSYIASEINSQAVYNLQRNEELALLAGDGVSPNLEGLLKRSGVQAATYPAGEATDPLLSAIYNVNTVSGYPADAIVMNPTDYFALRVAKDANGQYFGGGPFSGPYGNGEIIVNPPIWGLPTVVTSAVKAGQIVVGAFKTAKVFRKGGLRVESTNSHADNFVSDKVTVRVRERLALQVKYPAAFVSLTAAATS